MSENPNKWAAVNQAGIKAYVDAAMAGYSMHYCNAIQAQSAVAEAHRQGLTPQPAPLVVTPDLVKACIQEVVARGWAPPPPIALTQIILEAGAAYWTAQRDGEAEQ